MKIAMVVAGFPTLSETFILHQVTGLLDMGHDVRIISIERPDVEARHPEVEQYDLLERTDYLDIPATPLGLLGAAALASAKMLRDGPRSFLSSTQLMTRSHGIPRPSPMIIAARMVENCRDADIVHAHFGPCGLLALPAAHIARKPLVVTFHGMDVGAYTQLHGAGAYSLLFRHGSAFMCVSEYLRDRLEELGAPATDTVLQYITSTLHDVPYRERQRQDGAPVQLLTVARLTEKKGIEYSIEAVRRLVEAGADVRYAIAGDGPLREQLAATIAEAGLEERITLRGQLPRPEILQLLDESDIFVLTSVTAASGDTEGMPVVLREAHAAGMPIVTTDHSGNPEAIEDGVSGFVVPERDVDALTERLDHLISNPQQWSQMGRAGRKLVEERFDVRRLNERLVRIYENALAGHSPDQDI